MPATVADLVEIALSALGDLQRLGESITDEWQYTTDLEAVWRGRLEGVADARGQEPPPAGAAKAIDRLVAEAAAIADPHRAIDWLSTFPQAALIALGEPG